MKKNNDGTLRGQNAPVFPTAFLEKEKNKHKSVHMNVAIQSSRCVGIVGNFVWCKEFFARRDKLTIWPCRHSRQKFKTVGF